MSQNDDDLATETLRAMLTCLKFFAAILGSCILLAWIITGTAPWQVIGQ